MTIRPLGDRLIVRMDPPDRRTASGLELVSYGNDDRLTAQVLAVGPGTRCPACGHGRPLIAAIGDYVLLAPQSAVQDVIIEGQTVTIVREQDILARLDTHAESQRTAIRAH